MKIKISSKFSCSKETAWEQLMKSKLLDFIANPIVKFQYIDSKPVLWRAGTYRTSMKILGFIPFGEHSIVIEFPDNQGDTKILRDNGYGQIISKWDHKIFITPIDSQTIEYTDEVTVQAGFLTPFIGLFAWIFYNHRQKRWKKLISQNFKQLYQWNT